MITSLSGGVDGGGNAVSPLTTIGNPRNQPHLDAWLNKKETRSRNDIKRQECIYSIATSQDGNIVIAGNMSANIDNNYSALVQHNCQLDMPYHLFQAIPDKANSAVNLNNVSELIASQITTGRKPGNVNEVAEFVVNNIARPSITAGQVVDLYEGTYLGFANSITTPLATAYADVDVSVNPLHTCVSGAVYEYKVPAGLASGIAGRPLPATKSETIVKKQTFSFFPNPTNRSLLYTEAGNTEKYTVELLDISGRIIKKFEIPYSANVQKSVNYDISNINSGTYILRIANGTTVCQIKIIKQ